MKKNDHQFQSDKNTILRVPAVYDERGVPTSMRGNPLVETLRMVKGDTLISDLSGLPRVDLSASRAQEPEVRLYDLRLLKQLFVPHPIAAKLARAIDLLIWEAYADRNPFDAKAEADVYSTAERLRAQGGDEDTQYGGIFLDGMSGMGKTRLVRRILARYPRAIVHSEYKGRAFNQTQVLWLSVTAPVAGSMKALLLAMMQQRDRAAGLSGTDGALFPEFEGKRATVEEMLEAFCQAAAGDQLGILHIDDFQRVAEARSERVHILQFIINLSNAVKCPILFSGTPATLELIKSDADQNAFETARRLCSGGHLKLQRPTSQQDPFFRVLVNALFKYQWIEEPLAVTEEVYRVLYELSAGLPSVLTFLHRATQRRLLEANIPRLTLADYGYTWEEDLQMLHRPLSNLAKSRPKAEIQFETVMEKVKRDSLQPSEARA